MSNSKTQDLLSKYLDFAKSNPSITNPTQLSVYSNLVDYSDDVNIVLEDNALMNIVGIDDMDVINESLESLMGWGFIEDYSIEDYDLSGMEDEAVRDMLVDAKEYSITLATELPKVTLKMINK